MDISQLLSSKNIPDWVPDVGNTEPYQVPQEVSFIHTNPNGPLPSITLPDPVALENSVIQESNEFLKTTPYTNLDITTLINPETAEQALLPLAVMEVKLLQNQVIMTQQVSATSKKNTLSSFRIFNSLKLRNILNIAQKIISRYEASKKERDKKTKVSRTITKVSALLNSAYQSYAQDISIPDVYLTETMLIETANLDTIAENTIKLFNSFKSTNPDPETERLATIGVEKAIKDSKEAYIELISLAISQEQSIIKRLLTINNALYISNYLKNSLLVESPIFSSSDLLRIDNDLDD